MPSRATRAAAGEPANYAVVPLPPSHLRYTPEIAALPCLFAHKTRLHIHGRIVKQDAIVESGS